MQLARAEAPPVALPRPPIRLRLVLALVLVASATMWLFPRAEAGWKLHALAVTFANYAQCMVGPTGPSLLRGNSEEFQRLVRRRLVSSPAGDRPFAKCAKDAGSITGSPESERAHQAQASEFQEYGLSGARGSALGLSQIRITTLPLGELSERAWPFVREGYTRLLKPSLGASEAPHPVALPKPAVGRGLPSWRTHYRAVRRIRDEWWVAMGQGAHLSVHRSQDGITFRSAPARSTVVDAFAERCPAGESGKSFRVGLSADGNMLSVSSLEPDGPTLASDLAPASLSVAAAACDERALVAALEGERAPGPAVLKLCPFAGRCGQMPMPRLSGVELPAHIPIDLARVRGTTLVAITTGEVVRVASSRDDGRTWTPFSVAFDQAEYPELRVDVRLPGRLLTLGERVILYGGAAKSQLTYPVLVSDDHGASFRTP
jgi:hypothetical protein